MHMHKVLGVTAILLAWGAPLSHADSADRSDSANEPELQWRAQAQGGLLLTSGNSSSTTLAGALKASLVTGDNRVDLHLAGAFARSSVFMGTDRNGDMLFSQDEVERITSIASQSWLASTRYARALTRRNLLVATTSLASDKPAGTNLVASGQLGYGRVLAATNEHRITLEAGYDFSYEQLRADDRNRKIHSLRGFLGYEGRLSEDTSLELSGEALVNVNSVQSSSGPIDPIDDTRFKSEVSLTTELFERLSFRFGFSARYDNRPALRPELALPYSADFKPEAERLDSRTEATLILTLL